MMPQWGKVTCIVKGLSAEMHLKDLPGQSNSDRGPGLCIN